jgi:hypothetical protein
MNTQQMIEYFRELSEKDPHCSKLLAGLAVSAKTHMHTPEVTVHLATCIAKIRTFEMITEALGDLAQQHTEGLALFDQHFDVFSRTLERVFEELKEISEIIAE